MMATFHVLEDETVCDRFKRKFEDMNVNEEVAKKRGCRERVAFQCLNAEPQNDCKRAKTKTFDCTHNVRNIVVDQQAKRTDDNEEENREHEDDFLEEELQLDRFETSGQKADGTCSFPKELLENDEYREEVFQYLMQLEQRYEWPAKKGFSKQKEITANMRSVLVNWLISVGDEYKMTTQTIHLTVNFVDRFISKMLVASEKFQLIGAAAIFVASKTEEVYAMEAEELVYLCGDAYTVSQILKMEELLLKVLKFDVQPPTMLSFINYICMQHKLDEKTLHLSMYLSELVLLDGLDFMDYLPSKLAAACVALARLTLSKRKPWPNQLVSFSGYTLKQLSPIVVKQHKVFSDSPMKAEKAVRNKYLSDKYNNVAALHPKDLTLQFLDEE